MYHVRHNVVFLRVEWVSVFRQVSQLFWLFVRWNSSAFPVPRTLCDCWCLADFLALLVGLLLVGLVLPYNKLNPRVKLVL